MAERSRVEIGFEGGLIISAKLPDDEWRSWRRRCRRRRDGRAAGRGRRTTRRGQGLLRQARGARGARRFLSG